MELNDLQTPALWVDLDAFEHNVATMSRAHPGRALRPHVKAFKSTALAARLPEVAVVGVHVQGLDEAGGEEASARIGEALERTQMMTYVEPQFASAKLKGREVLVLEDFALKAGRDLLEDRAVL